MSGLQLIVTDAGRAALVNAQNTGTAPVLVAQVGVTATAFAASASTTALPGEVKRLSTISGQAVADDTIHVTIADDSADVYSMRGFALYLGDGTLFALYGQAGVILEKSAQATLLLSTDVRFVDVAATSLTFGNADFTNPPATTEVQGVVELATAAEAIAGADNTRAMTPAVAKAATDDRFGAGAPTGFVKGLLNLTTAALFRTAIGLGDLSTRNGGAGNGVDADLLDGQHGAYYLSWANLTGKPATFAPNAHGHGWADITGAPATATRWPDWNEVTGKPGSFTPTPHNHAWSDITSGVPATATRWPAVSEVTGLQAALDAKAALGANVSFSAVSVAGGLKLSGTGSGLGPSESLVDFYINRWLTYSSTLDRFQFGGARLEVPSIYFGESRMTGSGFKYLEFESPHIAYIRKRGGYAWYWRCNDTGLYGGANELQQMALDDAGNLTVSGAVTAPAFAQSSSRRYKRDIRDLDPRLARELLDAVQWSAYTMRADGSHALGTIAEDLADGPLDFVVRRTMGGMPEAVDYQPLFVLAAALVQHQARQIDDLSARLTAIEARA